MFGAAINIKIDNKISILNNILKCAKFISQ